MHPAAQRHASRMAPRRALTRASRSVVALLAAVAGFACTSQALAGTYYVLSGMSGKSGLTPSDAVSDIKTAVSLAQAATGSHVIIVGPGEYDNDITIAGTKNITLIADVTATSWETVSSMKAMPQPGPRSVTISGQVSLAGTGGVKRHFIGFHFEQSKGTKVIIESSPTVTFEDCGFIGANENAITLGGPANLTLRRCNVQTSETGILGAGKSLDGAIVTVVGSKFLAGNTAMNIEGPGAVKVTASRSYFANGLRGISVRNGPVDVSASIFANLSGAAVWQEEVDDTSSVTLNGNTLFDVAAGVDGNSLYGHMKSGMLEISVFNSLFAYSGPIVTEDGNGALYTVKTNLEWLSRTDPNTDGLVKKFGSVRAALPGFVNVDSLDLRLTADATDALGQAQDTTSHDFFGQDRAINQSVDIGAIDRRPMDIKFQERMSDWYTNYTKTESIDRTSPVVLDHPAINELLSPKSTELSWSELYAFLDGSYSDDTNSPGMKLSNTMWALRPNYNPTTKLMWDHGFNGWFDPSTTQQFAFESGAADYGSILKFDLWVADATESPAVVTIKVNGVPMWRHTVLAGTGTNAPPVTGWSLPMYPVQATGDVTGDASKNDLAFFGITVPTLPKYMSPSSSNIADVIEFSVDNCSAWALGNVRLLPHENLITTNAPFRDVTIETGTGFFATTDAKAGVPSQYRGILLADTRGEGKLDIVQANSNSGTTRYSLASESMKTETTSFSTTKVPSGLSTATFQTLVQDADNDGTLELVEVGETSTVVTNVTGSAFASKSKTHSFSAASGTPRASAVFDADADGWCDIFHAFKGGNTILKGSGAIDNASQSFAGWSENPIVPNTASDYGEGTFVSIADLNNDGTPDIFYPLGSGRFWVSSYNSVTKEVTYSHASRGISISVDPAAPAGMAWGDYDNDGDLDLFVPDRSGHAQLWKNPGAWTSNFTNVATTVGLASSKSTQSIAYAGASAAWGDYDNDGDLDLVMTTGKAGAPDAVRLFINSGAPSYTFSRLYGFGGDATTEGGDVRFVDYDNDGYLDIVVASDTDKFPTRIFRNELRDNTPTGSPVDKFLKVRVVGRGAGGLNAAAIGARVELRNASDESLVARRDVGLTQGLGGMDPLWVHFGGVDTSEEYIVRVYGPTGYSFETTVVPAKASTTISGTTIAQMLTVDEKTLRPGFNIRSYTEVAPDQEVEVGSGKK